MATHIQGNQPELGINTWDLDYVEIAGLTHQLGNGPWEYDLGLLYVILRVPCRQV